jgi:hypothetical protein
MRFGRRFSVKSNLILLKLRVFSIPDTLVQHSESMALLDIRGRVRRFRDVGMPVEAGELITLPGSSGFSL